MPTDPSSSAARGVYIDMTSAEALAQILTDTAAESAPTDHAVDRGFRAGIECAAKAIRQIAKECADRA